MTSKDTIKDTPESGAELAQGTPDEPAAPGAGDLVQDEGGRYGVVTEPGSVLWLGHAERHELPLRKVG